MDDPEDSRKTPQGNDPGSELYRAIADAASDGIFVVDEQTNILFVNRAAATMLGYSHVDLIGQDASLLMDAMAGESTSRGLAAFLQTGSGHMESKGTECTAMHKSGRKIPVEFTVGRFYAENKPRFVGVVRDLSERKQAEAEMRLAQDALRQKQMMEAVGQLSAHVAHDFNDLLGVIIGFSDLLLEQFPAEDTVFKHRVEEIKKAGNRAAALTRQLQTFGRKQVLQPKVLDLNSVVSDLCKMSDRLQGQGIELIAKLDPNLGQVLADALQMEQVIMNLLMNAREAMPFGGELTVETKNENVSEAQAQQHYPMSPGPYVMVAVSDTGVGMDKATQARIFEPFFSSKTLRKGTGLGLATVYGAVKQSGGYIWVDSKRGRGTTFKIYFPRVEPLWMDESRQVNPAEVRRAGETILVVENAEPLRSFLRDALRRLKFNVLQAANLAEGLAVATQREGSIHLLLTSVDQRATQAQELTERIVQLCQDIKILYLSGGAEEPVAQRGVLRQGVAFLHKPFTTQSLYAKIRKLLDQ